MNLGSIALGVVATILTLGAGLLVKWILDSGRSYMRVTWSEYVLIGVPLSIVVVIITTSVGWSLAYNARVTYHEYWNGWEMGATKEDIPCDRDGRCAHTYSCDPYIVQVPYQVCSGTGKNRTCTTQYRPETRYHQCPYTTHEYSYRVQTTLGDYDIALNRFPDNPQQNHWRSSENIPSWLIDQVGTGDPIFWTQAYQRVTSGKPGPVTKRKDYDNYILAADQQILKSFSDKVEYFKNAGLLPQLQTGVYNYYYADKVYFVGGQPPNPAEWQLRNSYLEGGFGTELQGDLHLVIALDPRIIEDPDGYIIALKAYWQNPQLYNPSIDEHDAISKNSVIVLLGSKDGKTVDLARVLTGMPIGNEYLSNAARDTLVKMNLHIALTAESIVGNISGEYYQKQYPDGSVKTKVKTVHNAPTGIVENLLWGLQDPNTKFVRVSMSGDESDPGFKFLASQIQPSTGQMVAIGVVTFIVSLFVWAFLAWFDIIR